MPMPRIDKRTAEPMNIAAILAYMQYISGESTSRMKAPVRRRQKQIIEVPMAVKLTFSEAHGMALSINDTTEDTVNEEKATKIGNGARIHNNKPAPPRRVQV